MTARRLAPLGRRRQRHAKPLEILVGRAAQIQVVAAGQRPLRLDLRQRLIGDLRVVRALGRDGLHHLRRLVLKWDAGSPPDAGQDLDSPGASRPAGGSPGRSAAHGVRRWCSVPWRSTNDWAGSTTSARRAVSVIASSWTTTKQPAGSAAARPWIVAQWIRRHDQQRLGRRDGLTQALRVRPHADIPGALHVALWPDGDQPAVGLARRGPVALSSATQRPGDGLRAAKIEPLLAEEDHQPIGGGQRAGGRLDSLRPSEHLASSGRGRTTFSRRRSAPSVSAIGVAQDVGGVLLEPGRASAKDDEHGATLDRLLDAQPPHAALLDAGPTQPPGRRRPFRRWPRLAAAAQARLLHPLPA